MMGMLDGLFEGRELPLDDQDAERRHQELMRALGRIENAILFAIQEITASIKIDEPKVTMRQKLKRGVFDDEPREHAGGSGIAGDHNGTKTFFKGERVVMDDSTHLAGVVEWCNDGMCRVQFDPVGKISMPSVVFPCKSLKRETARPFQIGDRVRAPKFKHGEGEIVEMFGKGFYVEFPQGNYYFEAEHLELIEGAQS